MTLDELEASYVPPQEVPAGCIIHDAYWDWTCRKGTKGCGVAHKDVAPYPTPAPQKPTTEKGAAIVRKFQNARAAIEERGEMAKKGLCYHCQGTMQELHGTLKIAGTRYFVCTLNAQHTVAIIPEDI